MIDSTRPWRGRQPIPEGGVPQRTPSGPAALRTASQSVYLEAAGLQG
jgi:hypothetical protein